MRSNRLKKINLLVFKGIQQKELEKQEGRKLNEKKKNSKKIRKDDERSSGS